MKLIIAAELLSYARDSDAKGFTHAIVALGDSYISGEAGRWKGNSYDRLFQRSSDDGTDLGAHQYVNHRPLTQHDTEGDCHRSIKSEIVIAQEALQTQGLFSSRLYALNIACSGAETKNILGRRDSEPLPNDASLAEYEHEYSDGELWFKGEQPQIKKLKLLAQNYDIKYLVLSIGGNDLNFGKLISTCAKKYLSEGSSCENIAKEEVIRMRPIVKKRIKEVINEIQKTMFEEEYVKDDYQFIVQSYPSPLPDKDKLRDDAVIDRAIWAKFIGEVGVPFHSDDIDWFYHDLASSISNLIKDAVKEINNEAINVRLLPYPHNGRNTDSINGTDKLVRFLDMREAFKGHEAGATDARFATGKDVEDRITDEVLSTQYEWVRYVVIKRGKYDFIGDSWDRGPTQESLHPNYFGQQALGSCLEKYIRLNQGWYVACKGSANIAPDEVKLIHPGLSHVNVPNINISEEAACAYYNNPHQNPRYPAASACIIIQNNSGYLLEMTRIKSSLFHNPTINIDNIRSINPYEAKHAYDNGGSGTYLTGSNGELSYNIHNTRGHLKIDWNMLSSGRDMTFTCDAFPNPGFSIDCHQHTYNRSGNYQHGVLTVTINENIY